VKPASYTNRYGIINRLPAASCNNDRNSPTIGTLHVVWPWAFGRRGSQSCVCEYYYLC